MEEEEKTFVWRIVFVEFLFCVCLFRLPSLFVRRSVSVLDAVSLRFGTNDKHKAFATLHLDEIERENEGKNGS